MVKEAKKINKPVIGNSDVHLLTDLGRTYTLIDAEKKAESIFRAIKNNKVEVITRPLPFLEAFHIACRAVYSSVRHRAKTEYKDRTNKTPLP